MDKIYDPFFSTKSDPKSPGLGLSEVYNIVKEHGGKISASSSEARTEVKILLPASS
jgi:nitrogen-specific signal transduction histidine kinase